MLPVNQSDGRFAAALQPFVDRHELAGAVMMVADREKVLILETVGYADIAARKAMPADALFWIASQSKPITATALMMLVDEGQVRIEDPLDAYLPEFAQPWVVTEQDEAHRLLTRSNRPLTIHHILSHTSGMPFQTALEEPTLDQLPLSARVRGYAMTPLDFQPESRYQYSNAGINTAGRIIEVVSGMAYADFLDERLFHPLGMTDTTFWPTVEQQARLAKSYTANADNTDLQEISIAQLAYPLDERTRQPMPAGGLFSTSGDIARFCQMILHGGVYAGTRYLSEAAVRRMTSRQTGETLSTGYGYGWDTPADGRFGHGGAYATQMYMSPASGLLTSILLQHAGFAGNGAQCLTAFTDVVNATFGL